MARYLVTGCAGFIGWKVSEFLLAGGHAQVSSAADPSNQRDWHLDRNELP